MTPSTAHAPGTLLVVLLLAGAGALGVWAAVPRRPAPRPQPGDVLLHETFDLAKAGPEGVSRRVVLKRPAVVEVDLAAGELGPVALSFGPPRPVEAGPTDLPDPDSAATTTWTADAAAPTKSFPALAPGLYVLHASAKGAPASAALRVVVRALPPR